MITPSVGHRHPLHLALTLVAAATLAACGGGSGGGSGGDGGSGSAAGDAAAGGPVDGVPGTDSGVPGRDDPVAPPPAGDIARYGVVNLGDDGTAATELVGVFLALPTSVAPEAFGAALDPAAAGECDVVPPGGDIGLGGISGGYLPVPRGVPTASLESLAAGDTVLLTSAARGAWTALVPGGAIAGNAFYEPASPLPGGAVPTDLVLDVPGAAFPAFSGATLPTVAPLEGFDDGPGDTIGADADFVWVPGDDPGAKIRLVTGTAAGFFADPGSVVNVFCTVPDTGSYSFDAETRAALGEDFEGFSAIASRVAIGTVADADALLILVRESDFPAR